MVEKAGIRWRQILEQHVPDYPDATLIHQLDHYVAARA
jgi:hypothetical protein